MSSSEPGFDRLRRRGVDAGPPVTGRRGPQAPPDPLGRRALYSVSGQPPAPGAVTLDCSECQETSVVTPRSLVRLALPSLHLPLVRREHPSWMRCPACGRRTWMRLGVRL